MTVILNELMAKYRIIKQMSGMYKFIRHFVASPIVESSGGVTYPSLHYPLPMSNLERDFPK